MLILQRADQLVFLRLETSDLCILFKKQVLHNSILLCDKILMGKLVLVSERSHQALFLSPKVLLLVLKYVYELVFLDDVEVDFSLVGPLGTLLTTWEAHGSAEWRGFRHGWGTDAKVDHMELKGRPV